MRHLPREMMYLPMDMHIPGLSQAKNRKLFFSSFSLGPVLDMHIHREMVHIPHLHIPSSSEKKNFDFQAWIIGEMHIHRLFPSVTLCECLSSSPSPSRKTFIC